MKFYKEKIVSFRSAINSSNIFYEDVKHKEYFYLICAVMDRVEDSISSFDNINNPPKNYNEILLSILHICIVYDGIKELLKVLHLSNPYSATSKETSYTFFKDVYLESFPNATIDNCPTDDKFFEYMRSMILAHPFNTNRPKFFQEKEVQYSPLLLTNPMKSLTKDVSDGIGFLVYSNKEDSNLSVTFSYSLLIAYAKSRYELIDSATKKVYEIIEETKIRWSKKILTIDSNQISTLLEIKETLKERFVETSLLDQTIAYLSFTPESMGINADETRLYQMQISLIIPDLVSAMNKLDHDKVDYLLMQNFNYPSISLHKMADYQLEKIFSYLNIEDSGSEPFNFGLNQSKLFYKEFANKWVEIDFDKDDCEKIKFLISLSLYLEFRDKRDHKTSTSE